MLCHDGRRQKLYTTVLHDKYEVEHLFVATGICLIEIALIIGVEIMAVHLLFALTVFGRDLAEILLTAEHQQV